MSTNAIVITIYTSKDYDDKLDLNNQLIVRETDLVRVLKGAKLKGTLMSDAKNIKCDQCIPIDKNVSGALSGYILELLQIVQVYNKDLVLAAWLLAWASKGSPCKRPFEIKFTKASEQITKE